MHVIKWSNLDFQACKLTDSLPDIPGVFVMAVSSAESGKWNVLKVGAAGSFATDVPPFEMRMFTRDFVEKHGRICIRKVDDPVTRRLLEIHLKDRLIKNSD